MADTIYDDNDESRNNSAYHSPQAKTYDQINQKKAFAIKKVRTKEFVLSNDVSINTLLGPASNADLVKGEVIHDFKKMADSIKKNNKKMKKSLPKVL